MKTQQTDSILEVRELSKHFGGVVALEKVSFRVREGSLTGLIGPNGAGKTTVFNILSGILPATSGEIRFFHHQITGWRADRIAALGIARTFQNLRLFRNLTVLENVLAGLYRKHHSSFFSSLLTLPGYRRRERQMIERAQNLLEVVTLEHKAEALASTLAYGEQRKLELVRALATEPKLLLLDEPTAGMNPRETEDLVSTIQKLKESYGLTILLIEHDMKVIMGICDHIEVLFQGRNLARGTPREMQSHPQVIEVYLGKGSLQRPHRHA